MIFYTDDIRGIQGLDLILLHLHTIDTHLDSGFNLEECRELIFLFNDPSRHSADVKRRTLEKVAEIERHISELQGMRTQLLALADSCPGDDSADCPIIDNLSGCCHRKVQA